MKCEMKNVQCCDHLCRSTQYTGAAPIALSPHSKLCRLTHRMFRKTDPELKLLAGAAHRTPSLHRHCCCCTDPSTVKDGNVSRHKGRYGKQLSPHRNRCLLTQHSVAALKVLSQHPATVYTRGLQIRVFPWMEVPVMPPLAPLL